MASEELKTEIAKLICGKKEGVAHSSLYGLLSTPVEIAKAVNDLSKDGVLIRVGSGKTSIYYDSKVFDSLEASPKKPVMKPYVPKIEAPKIESPKITDDQECSQPSVVKVDNVRRWPILQKGTAKAQIVWIYMSTNISLTNGVVLKRLEEEWVKTNTKPLLARNTLSVYCHILMKEGFIERVGRGVYKYCGPDQPFDNSDLPIFGSVEVPERRVLFREVVVRDQAHHVHNLLEQVTAMSETLVLVQTKLAKMQEQLKAMT